MKDIIFVCTGNTCRSPMAEGIAKSMDTEGRRILSRGVSVGFSASANEKAVGVMAAKGIDIRAHKSKQFDPLEVTDNTMVLTMTNRHKAFLLQQYPQITSKVETLMGYVGLSGEVSDPFGGSIEVYEACAKQMEEVIVKLMKEKRI